MAGHCCAPSDKSTAIQNPDFRRALWIALIVNAAMFFVELIGGVHAGSISLLADAVDFFGDAANYGLSLAVLSMGVAWRSRAALIKGICMGAFGLFVLGKATWSIFSGTIPEPATMGTIAFLALVANLGVAMLLYAYRTGDANMRSVWLCTRNDAIGNAAVMLAALGVFGSGSGWPDWLVAILMGLLAVSASSSIIRHAHTELSGQALDVHDHSHEDHAH